MKRSICVTAVALTALLALAACGASTRRGGDKPYSVGENLLMRKDGGIPGQAAIYPALENSLGTPSWGYINDFGDFVLKPVYSSAQRFRQNGLAVAGIGGKEGLINKAGKFVVEPVFQSIGEFSDDLAVVQYDNRFFVMDIHGNIISDNYPFIGDYKEGRAVYYINTEDGKLLYGYLGENGRTAVELQFSYAGDFDGGIAMTKLPDNGYCIIDKEGKRLKILKYSFVMDVSDAMIPFVEHRKGKYGYLNSNGDVAIPPAFIIAEPFRDGAAVVNASATYAVNRFGLIDKKGKYLIDPQYNNILQLGEGMVAVGLPIDQKNMFAGSKYALAAKEGTKEGTVLSDFIFYGAEQFRNGIASVYDNTTTFFIDKHGKRVDALPAAEGIGKLELLDDLVYADIDRRPYYMNREGEVIYGPLSSITLKSGVEVSENKFRPNRNYLVYYPSLSNIDNPVAEEAINIKLRDIWTHTKVRPSDNLDYNYDGSFRIGFNRKNLLELEKIAYNYPFGAAHGMPVREYSHIDARTGAFYQLKDLFKDGSDYVKVLGGIVKKQIEEHGKEMGVWQDSYKGIKPDQPFYLSADALILYFEPYEIAPYAAGFPEFTVPFADVRDVIDNKGSFWLSFN